MNSGADSYFADKCFKALCCLAYNGDGGLQDIRQANATLRDRLHSALFHLIVLEKDCYAQVPSEQLWHLFDKLLQQLKKLQSLSDDYLPNIAQELISFVEQYNRERGARSPETTFLG